MCIFDNLKQIVATATKHNSGFHLPSAKNSDPASSLKTVAEFTIRKYHHNSIQYRSPFVLWMCNSTNMQQLFESIMTKLFLDEFLQWKI